eukprot:m.128649 g.128649  ORF g.128649 m.128649 type:complete len:88 (-) comp13875_c1_seq4:1181-1444(-)
MIALLCLGNWIWRNCEQTCRRPAQGGVVLIDVILSVCTHACRACDVCDAPNLVDPYLADTTSVLNQPTQRSPPPFVGGGGYKLLVSE